MEQGRRDIYKVHLKDSLFNEPTKGIRRILHKSQELGIKIKPATKNTLNSLSEQRPHQGVCLEAGKLNYLKNVILPNENEKLIVYLDSIQVYKFSNFLSTLTI